MPTEYSNFSQPDDPNEPVDARYDATGKPIPVGADNNYHPADGAGFSVETRYGDNGPSHTNYQVGHGPGKNRSGDAWGGYNATWEIGPDGKPVENFGKSGWSADMDRYSGLAYGSQQRGAVQNDYGAADAFAKMGQQTRNAQTDAMNMQRDVARNGDAQSQQLGQRMLRQGADAQVAGALSVSNDPLTAATALQQQRGGVAAYMQKGNQALEAQRADDMANGRAGYLNAAAGVRAGDQTAQGLNQRQGIEQGKNEVDQRGLNDARERGFEDIRYDVDAANQGADIKRAQIGAGVYTNQLAVDQSANDRNARNIVGALNTVSSGASKVKDDNWSDRRSKNVVSIVDIFEKGSR